MPRIEPLPAKGLLRRVAYRYARRRFGQMPEPLSVAAHDGGVFWANALLETMVERRWRALPVRLGDLVSLRSACVIGCPWCVDFGSHHARRSLSGAELRGVSRWEGSEVFGDIERRVLEYADAATATPMRVTDEMVDALVSGLGKPATVELAAMVALENYRSRFNHGLGITAQGFTSGDACAVPVVH